MDNQNPLLAGIKLPGRTFRLPSGGALYKNGEVDNAEAEVHVHAMSALTEINLKNPDLLFNGKALVEVCKECVPAIKKPTELCAPDIDALMFYLRLVTYGPAFQIKVKHNCEHAKEHQYEVNIERIALNAKQLDPTTIDRNFTLQLDNGQTVKVGPVKFAHLIKLFQMNTGKSEFTSEDVKRNVVFNLTGLIEEVDGVTNKKHIEEWVSQLTTKQQNAIAAAIERTSDWGPEKFAAITCRDCGESFKVELPLNPIDFFTE
jgi:hypothetical protein